MAELKDFVLAEKLWDPSLNTSLLIEEFLVGYYGSTGASYVRQHLDNMHRSVLTAGCNMSAPPPSPGICECGTAVYFPAFRCVFHGAECTAFSCDHCLSTIFRHGSMWCCCCDHCLSSSYATFHRGSAVAIADRGGCLNSCCDYPPTGSRDKLHTYLNPRALITSAQALQVSLQRKALFSLPLVVCPRSTSVNMLRMSNCSVGWRRARRCIYPG